MRFRGQARAGRPRRVVAAVKPAPNARGALPQRTSKQERAPVRRAGPQYNVLKKYTVGRSAIPTYIYYIVPNGEKQQNEYDPRKYVHCVCGAPHYVMWIAPLCRCRAGLGLLCGVGRPTMSLPCKDNRMLCFGCHCRAGVGLLRGVGRPTMSLPCKENHMLCLGVLVRNQHPTKHETNLQEVRVQSSI